MRLLKLLLERRHLSNALEFRSEVDFQCIGVSLVCASSLSHIACSAVKHGYLRRECGYGKWL